MNSHSKLIEEAVDQFATLPGVGRKTALRLVLHLLKRSPKEVERFANAFTNMRENIHFCKNCFNLADSDLCAVCSTPSRNHQLICVVEDIRDIMALESTQQYRGIYHVLGGVISPMDGIGPSDLRMEELIQRVANGAEEVILALNTTMEGDTTCFYIYRKIKDFPIKVSTLARGVAIGDDLEYTDEVTLGRSLTNRTPYEASLSSR
jgi:recombination protein RecR